MQIRDEKNSDPFWDFLNFIMLVRAHCTIPVHTIFFAWDLLDECGLDAVWQLACSGAIELVTLLADCKRKEVDGQSQPSI